MSLSPAHRKGLTATGRASFAERGHDLYQTPPCAVRALLKAETLPTRIWEPAAGRGAIVDVLRAAGHVVLASDLVNYGIRGQVAGRNFLREQLPQGCQAIVTNPPFKDATAFARHALAIACPYTAMLLRLAFLEGSGRSDVIEGGHLSRVYVFRNRVPRMHREGWDGARSSSSIAFAWFIWEKGRVGPTELLRFSWEK
jgi:hypothetical protein